MRFLFVARLMTIRRVFYLGPIMKNKITMTIIMILALSLAAEGAAWAERMKIAIIDSGAKDHVDQVLSFTSIPGDHDPLNHGTYVAQLIRQGYPQAHLIMLQVCEKRQGRYLPSREAIFQAIQWCIKNNIQLVNMSLVTRYDSQIEKIITNASTSHGLVFVAAAGNKTIASRFASDGRGFIRRKQSLTKPAFPASSQHVISVGAVDMFGEITDYSDQTCDLYDDGKIIGQEGTSFASARITAKVASLLKTQGQLSPQHIIQKLQKS